jgi:hypothetical protein
MSAVSFSNSAHHEFMIVRASISSTTIGEHLPPIGRLELCYLVNKHGIHGQTGHG